MNTFLLTIKRYYALAAAFFPSPLPRGMTEFKTWSSSIISTYNLPDNDSVRFSLAVMVLHLDSTNAFKPKRFFGLSALKGMSNQVVSQVIQDLKAKQQAEAIAVQSAVVDEQKQ